MALETGTSMAYDAPEIVQAKHAGKRMIMADRTVDVWALGIMAFEMLTKTQVFDRNSNDKVRPNCFILK